MHHAVHGQTPWAVFSHKHTAMPLLAHPRLTAWAARLIQAPASSLAWHQRLMRRRLLLGTQMTDVEADMYDRGLWFFGLFSLLGSIPFGLFLSTAFVYGLFEGKVSFIEPHEDDIFLFVSAISILALGFAPLFHVGLPLIAQKAAQEYKIPPQPYQTWTEQVVQHTIFRAYLQHLIEYKRWNPIYWVFCYFVRAGAPYHGMFGHSHLSSPIFATYSVFRALTPVLYAAIFLSALALGYLLQEPESFSILKDYGLFILFVWFGISALHLFIGKAHGDIFSKHEISTPYVVTRELALKSAIYAGIGGAIATNFHHIKAWVLSWF